MYNAKDFYGELQNRPMENLKKMTRQFDALDDFDTRVDQDSLVGQNWKPMKVNKTILGLSDSRELNKDAQWATHNYDQYSGVETGCLADTFRGKNRRNDQDSNIAEDYSQALMDRSRYTSNDKDDCMGDARSMDVAASFDRSRRRFPRENNSSKYMTSADFYDNTYEEYIRPAAQVPRSYIKKNPCGSRRPESDMPRHVDIGSFLLSPVAGQKRDPASNRGPNLNVQCAKVKTGAQVSRDMKCRKKGPITIPDGGKIAWTPWFN